MRIAAISDVHGNLPALRAVLADIRRRGCDAIANLGDLASGPLWPEQALELLMALDATTIRGNHERQLLDDDLAAMGESDRFTRPRLDARQLDWIAALPAQARIDGEVLLLHGTPGSDTGYLLERVDPDGARAARPDEVAGMLDGIDARLVLCGHSHVPRAIRLGDGRLCVNPGSVGLQAFGGRHPHPHVMQSGTPAARYAMLQRDSGAWRAELLAVDHDPAPGARLAQDRGFDEWADALREGRLST